MRTPLNALVTEKILSRISQQSNSDLVDQVLTSEDAQGQIKNVCAKVSIELSDRIDELVGILGCSKRKFLEAAFLEAVDKAEMIIQREGFYEVFAPASEGGE